VPIGEMYQGRGFSVVRFFAEIAASV
jgi:hypothetical protein